MTKALLKASDRTVIAARRQLKKADVWLLPNFTTDQKTWVRHIWRLWHEDGKIQVGPPSGFDDLAWMTFTEQFAERQRSSVIAERENTLAELDRRETAALDQLAHAQDLAEMGQRRVLTEQGDGLVEAVVDALRLLGSDHVESLDGSQPGMKREDLQIWTGTSPWVCLAEIKGETGGAKTVWWLFTIEGVVVV